MNLSAAHDVGWLSRLSHQNLVLLESRQNAGFYRISPSFATGGPKLAQKVSAVVYTLSTPLKLAFQASFSWIERHT